jgi:hypothetical protein
MTTSSLLLQLKSYKVRHIFEKNKVVLSQGVHTNIEIEKRGTQDYIKITWLKILHMDQPTFDGG